jgi:hypothetical protein
MLIYDRTSFKYKNYINHMKGIDKIKKFRFEKIINYQLSIIN